MYIKEQKLIPFLKNKTRLTYVTIAKAIIQLTILSRSDRLWLSDDAMYTAPVIISTTRSSMYLVDLSECVPSTYCALQETKTIYTVKMPADHSPIFYIATLSACNPIFKKEKKKTALKYMM